MGETNERREDASEEYLGRSDNGGSRLGGKVGSHLCGGLDPVGTLLKVGVSEGKVRSLAGGDKTRFPEKVVVTLALALASPYPHVSCKSGVLDQVAISVRAKGGWVGGRVGGWMAGWVHCLGGVG